MFICGHDFEGKLFVEGLLFQFYFIFNASSQLKIFSYPVISIMLLLHTLGHAESILYVCSFKIYTLERQATLSLSLVNQCNRIKWSENLQTIFFIYME